MADVAELLKRYRSKGVLVDANLLVLYVLGRVNPARISSFKRTQKYTSEDFELLTGLLDWFGTVRTTPHVVSQTSDLAAPGGKELYAARTALRALAENIEEHYEPSRILTSHPLFHRFGLADSAIATAADRGGLILTDDVRLQIAIELRGGDALNFNHLRGIGMEKLWQEATR